MADVRADDCHGDEELFSASSGGDLHISATSLTGQSQHSLDTGQWHVVDTYMYNCTCRL